MASKGWFGKFKKQQSLYTTKLKVEGPSDVQSTTSNCSVEMKTECSLQVEQAEVQEVVVPIDKLTRRRLALFFTLLTDWPKKQRKWIQIWSGVYSLGEICHPLWLSTKISTERNKEHQNIPP